MTDATAARPATEGPATPASWAHRFEAWGAALVLAIFGWLPLDAAWAMLHTIGITAGAPHANAARLFVDFALSRQGQEIFRDAGYLPVRPDTSAAKASLRPEVSGFRATVFAPEDIDRNLARWSSIYTTIFRR